MLTFGFGAHHCLGMHVAKAELGAIVDAVCDFLPTGARILPELIEFEPLCTFPRPVTFAIDFGG